MDKEPFFRSSAYMYIQRKRSGTTENSLSITKTQSIQIPHTNYRLPWIYRSTRIIGLCAYMSYATYMCIYIYINNILTCMHTYKYVCAWVYAMGYQNTSCFKYETKSTSLVYE